MQPSLGHAAFAEQRGGVAQSFATVGEIPDSPVLFPVRMAARTAEIAVPAHARIGGVVKNFLPLEHSGWKFFAADGADQFERLDRSFREGRDLPDVMHGHRAREKILGEQLRAVRTQHQSLRRGPGAVQFRNLFAPEGIQHHHAVVALDGHERVIPQRAETRRHRRILVQQIEPRAKIFLVVRQVDLRNDGPHRRVKGERTAVAKCAAQRVVLHGRHPGALAVGRNGDRAGVIRHTPRTGRRIGLGVRGEVDLAGDGEVFRPHVGHPSVIAGRNEARDEDAHRIGGDRHSARRRPHFQRLQKDSFHRINFQQSTGALQRDVSRAVVGAEHNAVRSRGVRQFNGVQQGTFPSIEHADGRVAVVDHPDGSVRSERERARFRTHRFLEELGHSLRINGGHRVVVGIHDPDALACLVQNDRTRGGWCFRCQGIENRLRDRAGLVFDAV